MHEQTEARHPGTQRASADTSTDAGFVAASLVRSACREWAASFRLHHLWVNFALEDLRDRYRRTSIGLAWIVVSFALFVLVKVTIFGRLSSTTGAEFGLFVALGFGAWTFISAMVVDACTAYMHARPWMLGSALPYPVYLLQAVFRNWLTFGLILAVIAPALAWKPGPWTWTMLWSLPGLAAYAVTSVWLTAILAPLCVRFRDMNHAAQTFMRLLFFATPILWLPSTDPGLAAIARLNPVSHYIALLRDPLLYGTLPVESWVVVVAITIVGLPLGLVVYARTRREVIFWI